MSRPGSSRRRHGREDRTRPVCPASGRKLLFKSRKHALSAMNHTRSHGPEGDRVTGVYKCPHCNGWHMTSKVQR